MPITSQDIQLRRAGAAGLGGAIASAAPQEFDAVSPAEAAAGRVEYRCEYVRNGHASLTLQSAKLWMSANTPSSSTTIEVGLGTSAIAGTEQTIASETTAPAGVTFSAAASEAAAIALGDLGPGQHRAVWFRRTVAAGASALTQDTYERTVSGESPEEVESPAAAAKVQNLWTGVPSTDGVVLTAKMADSDTANSSRVAISTIPFDQNPTSLTYGAAVAPAGGYRTAKHRITGLQPNTTYHYAIEVDGQLDTATTGKFKTLPQGPASFTMAFAGCSNHANDAAFAAITSLDPLFMLAIGDFQYMDITNPTMDSYHSAFNTSLNRTVRKETHSKVPTVYMWDDHDFQANDSTGRDSSNVAKSFRNIATTFFRNRVPVIPASGVATDTVHYSFVVGRVRFVISDLRADKTAVSATDNASKTMMGQAQKDWFKAELQAAKAAGQVVAWGNSVPWHGTSGTDDWSLYTTERTELANFIKAEALQGKIFILSSDMHALAISTGADYATGGGASIPIFHAGPFSQSASSKGGPYTYGPYPSSGNAQQYGVMEIVDDGVTMTVNWKGYSADGTLRMSHSFSPIQAENPTPTKFEATGGTVTESDGYKYWTFTSGDTLNVTQAGDVEYLVVAGGGAGASGNSSANGGGGAGGLLNGMLSIPSGAHTITVGAGGVGAASSSIASTNGGNSSVGSLITALGGGRGGNPAAAGSAGGSGGGSEGQVNANPTNVVPCAGAAGQGNRGGQSFSSSTTGLKAGSGGGGAGSAGGDASSDKGGEGGAGKLVWGRMYAGGGGGSTTGSTQGAGRDGGGSASKTGAASAGAVNTGSGGGATSLNQRSGNGGSGIVVIRRAV